MEWWRIVVQKFLHSRGVTIWSTALSDCCTAEVHQCSIAKELHYRSAALPECCVAMLECSIAGAQSPLLERSLHCWSVVCTTGAKSALLERSLHCWSVVCTAGVSSALLECSLHCWSVFCTAVAQSALLERSLHCWSIVCTAAVSH